MTVTQILVKTEEFVRMELTTTLVIVFLDMMEIIAKSVISSITSYLSKYMVYFFLQIYIEDMIIQL